MKPTAFNYADYEQLQAENEQLKADLAAAEKCISDVQTYIEMGSGKYAYRVIQMWRGRKEHD